MHIFLECGDDKVKAHNAADTRTITWAAGFQ